MGETIQCPVHSHLPASFMTCPEIYIKITRSSNTYDLIVIDAQIHYMLLKKNARDHGSLEIDLKSNVTRSESGDCITSCMCGTQFWIKCAIERQLQWNIYSSSKYVLVSRCWVIVQGYLSSGVFVLWDICLWVHVQGCMSAFLSRGFLSSHPLHHIIWMDKCSLSKFSADKYGQSIWSVLCNISFKTMSMLEWRIASDSFVGNWGCACRPFQTREISM